jgi:DnaJ family protein B protein 4
MTNHYEVLGVGRDASSEEIKRAYRSLSLKWHPDRNQSPDAQSKFQEISLANEVLSDDRKRNQYNCELDGGPLGQEIDVNDIINMMFGQGMGGMGEMRFGGGPGGPEIHVFHGQMPGMGHIPGGIPGFPGFLGGMPGFPPGHPFFHQMQKPQPIIKQLDIEFDQAYNGCTICVNVEKWTVKSDVKVHETEQVYVNIQPGIDNDEIIILRDCGNSVSPQLKGDIKFIVKVNKSEMFDRQGMDLLHKRKISLKEALTGFTFEIAHLNGKMLCLNNLKNRTIVTPNYKKTIPNLGMVRDGNVGNLIIEFSVVFPENLTEEQTNKIAEIL